VRLCTSAFLGSKSRNRPWGRRSPLVSRLQPLPECSSSPATRSEHELDLGMKTLMVLELPQAFADF
jgi:hypothetical protein